MCENCFPFFLVLLPHLGASYPIFSCLPCTSRLLYSRVLNPSPPLTAEKYPTRDFCLFRQVICKQASTTCYYMLLLKINISCCFESCYSSIVHVSSCKLTGSLPSQVIPVIPYICLNLQQPAIHSCEESMTLHLDTSDQDLAYYSLVSPWRQCTSPETGLPWSFHKQQIPLSISVGNAVA